MGTVPSRRGGRHGLVRSPSWILVIDKRAEFFYSSRLVGWEPAGDGGGEDRGGVPGLPVFLPVGTHASWQRWLGDPDASWGRRRRSCRFTRRPPTASSFFPVPCVGRSLRRIRPRCPTLRRLARTGSPGRWPRAGLAVTCCRSTLQSCAERPPPFLWSPRWRRSTNAGVPWWSLYQVLTRPGTA